LTIRLVEAIIKNVVKHPVLPDSASRAKLQERKSVKYSEKYTDYIHLGYLEWKKVFEEHGKVGKKAVLFVMTDDTRNCDEIAEYFMITREIHRMMGLFTSTGFNKIEGVKSHKTTGSILFLCRFQRAFRTVEK